MSATTVWLRAEARRSWRAWVGIVVVLGVAGGVALSAFAGARRTDSAYQRFLAAHRAYDVLVTNYPGDEGIAVLDLDEVAQLPEVAESARAVYEYVRVGAGTIGVADPTGEFGSDLNRMRIVDGRRFDPNAVDEVVVGFVLAEQHDLDVGDRITLFTHEDFERAIAEGHGPAAELRALEKHIFGVLPDGQVRIVGIEASPGEFPPQFGSNGVLVHHTAAFARALGDVAGGELLAVRLHRGEADVRSFREGLVRLSGGLPVLPIVQSEHARSVQRSFDLQALALSTLGALVAVVGALLALQLTARQTFLESQDHTVLRAVGLSRRQVTLLGAARSCLIGVAAAGVAVVLAVASSPLTPFGLARTAEPDPGLRLDLPVLGAGVAALVVVSGLMGVASAARAARAAVRSAVPPERPSWITRAAAVFGARPVVTAGIRMAFEQGRGPTAVPVRSTFLAVVIGITVLVGSLVFGSSLSHLLDTPDLYGLRWDVEANDWEGGIDADVQAALVTDDRVAGFGVGDLGMQIEVGGESSEALVFDEIKGDVGPPILVGRYPEAGDEIALGRRTARRLRVEVGDSVDVGLGGAETAPMTVVGEVVLPSLSSGVRLGEGAMVGRAAWAHLFSHDAQDDDVAHDDGDGDARYDSEEAAEDDPPTTAFIKVRPGVDPNAVLTDLSELLPQGEAGSLERGTPTDIVNFGRVEHLPLLLGAAMGLLSALTLINTVASSVRRRARDLAVLRALGVVPRQSRWIVGWQTTALVVAALIVAIPLGLALGRIAWSLLAESLGIVSVPQVPVRRLALVASGLVLASNLLAFVPARAASRIRPGLALRRE